MKRIELAGNILATLPYVFKKFMKVYHNTDVPRQQIGLMFKVMENPGMPIGFYSEKMMIPKSNVTVISTKLVDDGLLERVPDEHDRRIITLKITQKGDAYMAKHKESLKHAMLDLLVDYTDEELYRLNELIVEMKEIMDRRL